MAHGLESRTPFVDHEVVQLAATLPALVKFRGGELKRALKLAVGDVVPPAILARKDKMGFPVPLTAWLQGGLREYVLDTFAASSARRSYLDPRFSAEELLAREPAFGRTLWGLLSLELWQQSYHDRVSHWAALRARMTEPDQQLAAL